MARDGPSRSVGSARSVDSDASVVLGNGSMAGAMLRVAKIEVTGRKDGDCGTLRKPFVEYVLQISVNRQVSSLSNRPYDTMGPP